MLTKNQVIKQKTNTLNESVIKMGDLYRAKVIIDIPRSLINGFVSKAKKENGIDVRETWADVDIAELIIEYIKSTYMNIESLSVTNMLGEPNVTPGDVQTDIQPEENVQSQPEVQSQPGVQSQQEIQTQL